MHPTGPRPDQSAISSHHSQGKPLHSKSESDGSKAISAATELLKATNPSHTPTDNNLQQKPGRWTQKGGWQWIASKVVVAVGSKYCGAVLGAGSDFDQQTKEANEELAILSKGPQFGWMLSILGEELGKNVMPALVESVAEEYLSKEASAELRNLDMLSSMMQLMLPRIVVNIAKNMRQGPENGNIQISPVSVISFLLKKVIKGLDEVDAEFDALKASDEGKLLTEEALKNRRKEMIHRLAAGLIQVLFPNGVDDFPYSFILKTFHAKIWSRLNETVENKLCQLDDSRHVRVLPSVASEALETNTRRFAEAAIDVTRGFLTNDSQQAVAALAEKLPISAMEESDRKLLLDYVGLQMREIGAAGQHSIIGEAWKLLRGSLGSSMTHMISHIINDAGALKSGGSKSAAVVAHLLQAVSSFLKQNGFNKPADGVKSIKVDGPFIQKFESLAKKFEEMMGVGDLPFLQKASCELLFAAFPKLMAEHCEEALIPLAELFDAIDASAAPSKEAAVSNSDSFSIFCHLLGKIVAHKAREWIKGESKTIANTIASSIPNTSREVIQGIEDWLHEKLEEFVNDEKEQKIWKFIEETVPKILSHVVYTLSKGEKDNDKIIFSALNSILHHFSDFAEKKEKELYEARGDRDALIKHFTPFCEEMMDHFGIGKKNKLPVPYLLHKTVEEQIQKLAPEQYAKAYQDLCQLSDASIDKLKEGGEANKGVAVLSELASQYSAMKLEGLFKNQQFLRANSEKIADAFVDHIFSMKQLSRSDRLTQDDAAKKDLLKKWLTEQIEVIGPKLNETYPAIWQFFEKGLQKSLAHVASNLSKGNVKKTDATMYVINAILLELKCFFSETREKISKTYDDLKMQGIEDPLSHQDYIQLFEPLAKNLQKKMGLSEYQGMFNVLFTIAFMQLAPFQLAKYSFSVLLPVNRFYEGLENPHVVSQREDLKLLPGGERAASVCKALAAFVTEKIPKYCADLDVSSQLALMALNFTALPSHKDVVAEIAKSKDGGEAQAGEGAKSPFPEQSKKMCNDLYAWFKDKIRAVGKSDDPEIKKYWDLAGNTTDAFLSYVMLNLAGKDDCHQDAFLAIVNNVMECYDVFTKKYGVEIHEHYTSLKRAGQDPSIDQTFIDHFSPLVSSIMEKAGIDKGQELPFIPKAFQSICEEHLYKLFTDQLAKLYCSLSSSEDKINIQNDCRKRIRQAFGSSEISADASHEDAIQAVENLSAFFAERLLIAMKDTAFSTTDPRTAAIKKIGLLDAVPFLQRPNMHPLVEDAQSILALAIFQLFANRFESMKKDGKKIDHTFVSEMIDTMLASLFVYSPEELAILESSSEVDIENCETKELQQLFAKRSSRLLALIKADPATDQGASISLLLTPAITELLWKGFETFLLPNFLAKTYLARIQGKRQAEEASKNMEKLTGSDMRPAVCDMLARFITEFVPTCMTYDQEWMAEDLYRAASQQLIQLGKNADSKAVEEYLQANKKILMPEIAKSLVAVSSSLKGMEPMTREALKTFMIQVLSRVTQHLDHLEKPEGERDKDFLVKQSIDLMEILKAHLEKFNEAGAFLNKNYEATMKKLVRKDLVHKGMVQSQEVINAQKQLKESQRILRVARLRLEAYKKLKITGWTEQLKTLIKRHQNIARHAQRIIDKEREALFFEPFTKKMLEVLHLTSAEYLPFPSPLRELVWNQFCNQALPQVFNTMFKKALEPHSLNRGISNALALYASNADGKTEDVALEYSDETQEKLNALCGDLFEQATKMLPYSFVRAAAKSGYVKEKIGKISGQALRRNLREQLSLQKIIDMSLSAFVNNMQAGKLMMQNEAGEWVPLDMSQPISGKNIKFEPAPGGFNIPENDEASELEALKRLKDEELAFEETKKDMHLFARKIIAENISGIVSGVFNKFIKLWNKVINKVFGKHSEDVRRFFKAEGFQVAYQFIKLMLIIAGTPVILVGWIAKQIAWAGMDLYIRKKVEEALEGIHMTTNEDLFYTLTDQFIESLRLKKETAGPETEPASIV